MKKIVAMAFAAATLIACESTTTGNETTDTTVTNTSTSDNAAYEPSEGDITRKDGKVMVYRDKQWQENSEERRMDHDVIVSTDGRATKNGYEREIQEGEIVTHEGDYLDRTGRSIENAWDETKAGVKRAGEKIGDAAKEAGKDLERATDRN